MARNNAGASILQDSDKHLKTKPVRNIAVVQQPVAISKAEQQLNVWIPKDLMKRLKVRGIESDKSLKEMVTEALEQFL
ncbi:hypothetical protein [Rudanella lutea]|uniref:hypothetical protein n=1 Tax=Rudanella lutea TaxID=451374 RepID=UPI000362DCBA|nr:hypothetical protein [Rudanella lutea]